MKVTCSYSTLCELCDQFEWRLELGREQEMYGNFWYLRAINDNDVLTVRARSNTLSKVLNPLTAALIDEVRGARWLHR